MLTLFFHLRIVAILVLAGIFSNGNNSSAGPIHLKGNAQGTTWHIQYYAHDTLVTSEQVDSVFRVIDHSLSIYKHTSLISAFNAGDGGMRIDTHFRNVVEKAILVNRATAGLFDITIAPLVNAWGFGAEKKDSIPTRREIRGLLSCVGTKNIRLRGDSLFKRKACVKLDVNGIAQGYTVDVLAAFLQDNGIHHFLVELGGEMKSCGEKPGGEPFRAGIEMPGEDLFSPAVVKAVELRNQALTTSGNYRKFRESGNRRLSHLLHPATGRPVDNDMISVTVRANDAITADAYDNALMLLGMKKALAFVEKRPDLAAYIIYRTSDGNIADTASTRWE